MRHGDPSGVNMECRISWCIRYKHWNVLILFVAGMDIVLFGNKWMKKLEDFQNWTRPRGESDFIVHWIFWIQFFSNWTTVELCKARFRLHTCSHEPNRIQWLKDVRAHCYCASLVRTLYMTWHVPCHVFQARAPSRNSTKYRADDLCGNLICEYFCWMLGDPHFFLADHFLFWFFPLY